MDKMYIKENYKLENECDKLIDTYKQSTNFDGKLSDSMIDKLAIGLTYTQKPKEMYKPKPVKQG